MMPNRESINKTRASFDALDSIFSGGATKNPEPPKDFTSRSVNSMKDLKNIKVPDSLVESIVSVQKVEEKLDEATATLKLNDVVQKLSSLIKEAKQILEMCGVGTGTGSLSVGPVKPMKPGKNKILGKVVGKSTQHPTGSPKNITSPKDAKPPKFGGKKA